jgi:hypothetical protein
MLAPVMAAAWAARGVLAGARTGGIVLRASCTPRHDELFSTPPSQSPAWTQLAAARGISASAGLLGGAGYKTAYALFTKAKYKEIAEQAGSVQANIVGPLLGEAWRSMSATERAHWDAQVRQDMHGVEQLLATAVQCNGR